MKSNEQESKSQAQASTLIIIQNIPGDDQDRTVCAFQAPLITMESRADLDLGENTQIYYGTNLHILNTTT